ncbi:MAG TPA: ABC transporter permease [Terracidiphilus sp.]|jgi:predicted permease
MSLLRRIGNLFSREKVDREIDAELQSHIDMRTEDYVAEGAPPEQARRDALVRFGSPTGTRERVAAMDAALVLNRIWSDIRFSCRQLVRSPGFAITAILVLALGMGASVAIFAFVDAALIKPLPYQDPNRLVSVYEVVNTCPLCNISYMNYQDWKKSNLPFSSIEAWGWASYLLSSSESTEPVQGARVSDGFFRTLGVTPMLGRDFYPGEDKPASPHTILITYASWQKRFGKNPGVVGREITLNNLSYTVIGVLPKDFHFAPIGAAEFWAALNDPSSCDQRRGCHGLFGLARLKDGTDLQTAAVAMQTVAQQLAKQYPDSNHGLSATATSLSDSIVGNIRGVLVALLIGASLLLLIALVNVANLVLVRAENRKRETAVRGALGASTARLLQQFVTEAMLLSLAGSVFGIATARLGIKLLVNLIPSQELNGMPFLINLGFSPRILTFAALLSVLAAALLTLLPALRIKRRNLRGDLADGSRSAASTSWRRLGSRLIVLELTTAAVLLVGAALLAKSFYLLLHVDLGIRPDHLATIVVESPKSYSEDDKLMVLERQMISQVSSLPGVKSAAISSHLPVRNWDGGVWIVIPGQPSTEDRNDLPERDVSFGYLETMGAQLLGGRYFTEAEDDGNKRRVVVVNHSLAKQLFPGEDPVGKHLAYKGGHDPMEIIGEIEDVKEGPLDTPTRPVIYVPFNQDSARSFYVVVRTSQDDKSLLPTISSAIHRIDANLATTDPATMSQVINDSPSAYLHRASAWLAGTFGSLALLLSVVGLYGVVSYSVNQRTREIGVRMALGAARGSVYSLVLKEAGRLIAIGVVAGLVCSVAGASLIRKLLFGIEAWDVPTLFAVAVSLAAFATLASYIPARRAAGLNPVDALRAE